MASGKKASTPRAARRRRWWHLRQRWRMLGVFEIDQEHEFFDLTSMIKEGMQGAIQASRGAPQQETLSAEHFRAEETQTHQGFVMQSFAAPVFARVRRSLDITEEEYLHSLCSDGCYLQFVSNSKSRADFFVTNDKRFFLKTQNRREVQFLLSNLQKYMEHLDKYPHSLMVRFLGVHRILIPDQMKTYFIVMQSVFYPDERINVRYDVKGCEVGRWTNPDTGGKQIIRVLKDNNFEGQHIVLGRETSWFTGQLKADAAFLRELGVMDYSLLLAVQPLHRDEQEGKHSLANLVVRTTKSLDFDDGPAEADPCSAPLLAEDADAVALQELRGPRADSELRDFREHHRRLLPNFKNAVHVIDGPQRRYFVGVIDVFTVYGWRKKMENLWKRLRYPGRAFSTVGPDSYAHRFCSWIQERTQEEPAAHPH